MSKLNSSHGFISLLYSIGDNPLGLWSKYVSSDGRVRRIVDERLNGDRVIEIRGPEESPMSTYISCPASPIDCLNIKLPVLVIILKNLKARITIALQLIDEEDIRRKFVLSSYETSGKITNVDHETARLSLKLENDWNGLEIDFRTLCQSIYRTEYKALQRLIIYQNCRLRRIYLQDRHYEHNETPVQLCQAFFDMYMLKWGINFVEKSCQTSVSYASVKNDETVPEETTISRVQHSAKSSTERLSNLKKALPTEGKKTIRTRNDISNVDKKKSENRTKILRGETTRRKVSAGNERKAPNSGKVASTPLRMEKNVRNENEKEGVIFREWPYNYRQYQQIEQNVMKKLKINDTTNVPMRINDIIGGKKCPIVDALDRKFVKEKVSQVPLEISVPPEVENEAAAENEKIVKSTRSKLLTTDEAVCDFLELRHIINRKMLENFQSRGLTMTEVELSIYNSKNRRNSYGQGKLVEDHRTRIDKACNVVTNEETPKMVEKSVIK